MKRVIILVLDSLGIGAAHDADRFGDVGSNTFGHIASAVASRNADKGRSGSLQIPNLLRLGLAHACELSSGSFPDGLARVEPLAKWGYAAELSSGKDTLSGHWEIAGVPVLFDWGYFPNRDNSFPPALLDEIVSRACLSGYLGNRHASGTEIIERLGQEHMQTGKPIFYTSADSVFQIACHEETFGLEALYRLCRIARLALEPYNIARVIARPFIGSAPGYFSRTGNRQDLSLQPPAPTVLEKLLNAAGQVVSVGKIADIYAHVGISRTVKATGLTALWEATLTEFGHAPERSIVMTNFVDFDSNYGHRRDVAGYAAALEAFDLRLPALMSILSDGDLLIVGADHGCDPTWPGSDHTREHIPVLCYRHNILPGSIGRRKTFADIGQTVACFFGLAPMDYGSSFLD